MKIYKKNISIEKGPTWKSVYYTFEDGEIWFIKKYSKRFTNKEIKDDVFPEIKDHFER